MLKEFQPNWKYSIEYIVKNRNFAAISTPPIAY